MSVTPDIARELAVFLRTRRERLTPSEAGLPPRRRARRTPGLRREEVAELAGVSVDYVVRLEQARGPHPSPEVLDALADALRLTDDERRYLFDLTRQRPARSISGSTRESKTARLVHDLSPLPAMLIDHRFDVLAWNAEMADLVVDFGTLPPEQRNSLEVCLFLPELREFYVDREEILREAIADLRAAWAGYPDDARLDQLIRRWCARSAEFAALWEQRDVRVNGRGRKRLLHPRLGPLTIEFDALTPLPNPGERLVVYRAGDAETRRAFQKLARLPGREPKLISAS